MYETPGLPGGSFDSNLSFAQALTEAVKAVPTTMLVASLPQSQVEVGGEDGAHALTRLARTIHLGSAPVAGQANKGLDMRRVRLGCVQPGENIAVFGDPTR